LPIAAIGKNVENAPVVLDEKFSAPKTWQRRSCGNHQGNAHATAWTIRLQYFSVKKNSSMEEFQNGTTETEAAIVLKWDR
jgi:hypothetical protein